MLNEIVKRIRNLSIDQQRDVLSFLESFYGDENRGCARRKVNLDIDATAGDKIIQANTEDISASGVYINVTGRFNLGQKATVVFRVPGQNTPFKIKGELVRVESSGIAIEFKDINPYFKKILDDAIWA